jgi:spore maturation protein CgeB
VGFKVVNGVYGRDHARVVCQSRINLNFTHGGTSDRAYKAMAAGGFMLTEPWPNMEDDLKPGVHLDTFTGMGELRDKIEYWLGHEDERMAMAQAGREVVEPFSRDAWARGLLDALRG